MSEHLLSPLQRAHLQHLGPCVMILEYSLRDELREPIMQLGGGWAEVFQLWEQLGGLMPYLVMAATTKERVRKRAPLCVQVRDVPTLREAIQMVCSQLDDVRCAWLMVLPPGSEAQRAAKEEVFTDSVTEGAG